MPLSWTHDEVSQRQLGLCAFVVDVNPACSLVIFRNVYILQV